MNRWSYKRRIRPMRVNDFTNAAKQLLAEVEKAYCIDRSKLEATIEVYANLPHSVTTLEPGLNEAVAERNAEMVSHTYTIGDDIPEDVWRKAVYVKATIRAPKDGRPIMIVLEGKGYLPKVLSFYVKGHSDEKSARIKQAVINSAPFAVGDGRSDHRSVSSG